MIYRYRSLTRKYRHLAILNNASAAMDLLPFDVKVFGPGFSHWDAENVGTLNLEESKVFDQVLDEMGQLSSKAQELASVLTTSEKLRKGADTIYVVCDDTGSTILGFLRLGRKHLFLYADDDASMCEEDAWCLLDFYVHEGVQRSGIGVALLRSALERERLTPPEIAYDRPSPMLKPFLRKHFNLHNCLDQPNRFMVFKEYFKDCAYKPENGC